MVIGGASDSAQQGFFDGTCQTAPNLSDRATQYLVTLGVSPAGDASTQAGRIWTHVLAVGYSPRYLAENADGIRQDWPRTPLPATNEGLLASAELGGKVAALLDVEESVEGVSTGAIRYELRPVGVIASVDGRQIDSNAGHLAVVAGWGHAGKGGVTMPGAGRLERRPWSAAELALIREGLAELDMTLDQVLACLGDTVVDVYLNDLAYWRCVPSRVWEYTIGGYQVVKKWLSYRERPLLGRDLTVEEARCVIEMARRIAAILLFEPALDANYERVKAEAHAWRRNGP